MTALRFLPLLLLLAFSCPPASEAGKSRPAALRDGDVLFQCNASSDGLAIERATACAYTHVGLVLYRAGEPYVFEAGPTVRFTPLRAWIANGQGGHFVAKRLRDAAKVLTANAVAELRREAAALEGRPYDSLFGWSDDRIYCSELVWKLYDRALGIQLGTPKKMRDFNLNDPLVVEKLKERFGKEPPLDELAISPGQVFDAERLKLLKTGS